MHRAFVLTIVTLAGCGQTDSKAERPPMTNTGAPIKVRSSVANMRIVVTGALPANPNPSVVEEYCSAYAVARPETPGGQQAAQKGWIVTSETKLGKYDAVSFVGALERSTSATCFHLNGNLGVFNGSKVVAIAYWKRSADNALTHGSDEIEDSLGMATQIDQRRIRLYWGLPAPPFADVVLRDGISVERTAPKDPACGGAAEVPNVFGEKIEDARKKLIAFGWQPQAPPPDEPMTGLFEQALPEVEACSGTGYGFCAFNYKHAKGFGLRVISVGEEYRVYGSTPYCSGSWQDRLVGGGFYSL